MVAKTKLVCWGDYEIEVPEKAQWMAFDRSGECWWYVDEPVDAMTMWYKLGYKQTPGQFGYMGKPTPPKKGDWHTQLYNIS